MSTPANATTGFEFKLADGSVVKAENIEEAFKTIVKMKEDTAAALKGEREQREQLAAQVSGLRTELQQKTAPPADTSGFQRDTYYKLVGEDPIMAQNYLDAFRFGVPDPAQVPQYFQEMSQTVTNLQQQTLAATFINVHPDFPAGDVVAADTLTKEVIRLRTEGHPVNMGTMDLAWRNCIAAESIKPVEEKEEQEDTNPSLGGDGSAGADAEAQRIEADVASGKMSMVDFEKYLRSKGMLGG